MNESGQRAKAPGATRRWIGRVGLVVVMVVAAVTTVFLISVAIDLATRLL